MIKAFLVIASFFVAPSLLLAQQKGGDTSRPVTVVVSDTSGKIREVTPTKIDSLSKGKDTSKPQHSPRIAAIRSAIFPGLGQIYNKKYWKVPIAWAAVGIPAYLVVDNNKWYKRVKYALLVAASDNPSADSLSKVHPQLKAFVTSRSTNTLLNYRSEFRKNMDYSILFGLLFWGLNVIDATVDAHLKGFNVSDDLTLKVKPALLNYNTPGISLVLTFK